MHDHFCSAWCLCATGILLMEQTKRKLLQYKHELIRNRMINFPSKLLVAYAVATGVCIEVAASLSIAIVTGTSSCFFLEPETNIYTKYITLSLRKSVFCIVYPLTGWLADTRIGRGRSVSWSLWACWLGSLLQAASFCIQFSTCGLPVNFAKYGISGVAFIFLTLGTSGLITNLPAFGLDQLYDKSNAHTRSFVHWFIWGLFVGFPIQYIVYNQTSLLKPTLTQVTGLYAFSVTSIALCLHGFFKDSFEDLGILKHNPYKLVIDVLKYTIKHKSPENRSALTYWENDIPNRFDLGKTKYGGPFKEEDVEDVKTFWRITGVIFSMFGLFIPYYYAVIGILSYGGHYDRALTDLNGFGMFALWQGLESSIIFLVPLYELVIIPCLPKLEYFMISPLKALGSAYVLVSLTLLLMMAIEIVGRFVTPETVDCIAFGKINLHYASFTIPLILTGLIEIITYIYGIEFICSQAPANMSGMLTGIFWFVRIVYVNIGSLFSLWTISGPSKIPCSFWILLTQLMICLIGLMTFIAVSKWYKRRRRVEVYNLHSIVADTYRKVLEVNESTVSSSEVYIVVTDKSDVIN